MEDTANAALAETKLNESELEISAAGCCRSSYAYTVGKIINQMVFPTVIAFRKAPKISSFKYTCI